MSRNNWEWAFLAMTMHVVAFCPLAFLRMPFHLLGSWGTTLGIRHNAHLECLLRRSYLYHTGTTLGDIASTFHIRLPWRYCPTTGNRGRKWYQSIDNFKMPGRPFSFFKLLPQKNFTDFYSAAILFYLHKNCPASYNRMVWPFLK